MLKANIFSQTKPTAKFSCNNSCGGVPGKRVREGTMGWRPVLFSFLFAGSDLMGGSYCTVASFRGLG